MTCSDAGDGEPNRTENGPRPRIERSERRRRSVRPLLFVIAGAPTGGFVGSIVPTFGLPGGVASLALVAVLFALPFLVDANWERIEAGYLRLLDRVE